MTGENII